MASYAKCRFEGCDTWIKSSPSDNPNYLCPEHGGPANSVSQRIPQRRCVYLDSTGIQCNTWFNALDDAKLCATHSGVVPSRMNHQTEEQKVRYIDLVNDQREYCYHFKDGTSQKQDQKLIFEFKDDEDGTVYEKLDRHIAFLESVIEDVKARLYDGARKVRSEKLSELSEEERDALRKVKITKVVNSAISTPRKTKADQTKESWSANLKKVGASIDIDPDELIAKFKAIKEAKENK